MKKFLTTLILILIILTPAIPVFAQGGFIPCGGYDKDGNRQAECGYYDLLEMVNRIVKWLVIVSAPIAAGVIAWSGFLYMTTGVSDQKSAAKKMITKVFIGFVFILGAWLIVSTILDAILADKFEEAVPVNFK